MARPKISRAPIPAGTVGLAKAFELVCEHRISDWREIVSQMEASSAELESKNIRYSKRSRKRVRDLAIDRWSVVTLTDDDFSPEQKEVMRVGKELEILAKRKQAARTDADRIMREALASGALVARIRNPDDGEDYPVPDAQEWLVSFEYDPGFRNDYVEDWHATIEGRRQITRPMPDQPGPPAFFADSETLHRVFFFEAEFTGWLGGEGAHAQTFTPYPDGVVLTAKCQVALDVMKTIWPGLPDKSAQATADRVNNKYRALGWKKNDGRGRLIKKFTEDDIKRVYGRKT